MSARDVLVKALMDRAGEDVDWIDADSAQKYAEAAMTAIRGMSIEDLGDLLSNRVREVIFTADQDDTDLTSDDLARMMVHATPVEIRGPLPAGGRWLEPPATFTSLGAPPKVDWVEGDPS